MLASPSGLNRQIRALGDADARWISQSWAMLPHLARGPNPPMMLAGRYTPNQTCVQNTHTDRDKGKRNLKPGHGPVVGHWVPCAVRESALGTPVKDAIWYLLSPRALGKMVSHWFGLFFVRGFFFFFSQLEVLSAAHPLSAVGSGPRRRQWLYFLLGWAAMTLNRCRLRRRILATP